MAKKLYFLKWDIDNESFILDVNNKANKFAYAIRRVKISEEQANLFGDMITEKFLDRGKRIDLNLLEFQFDRYFHVCCDCGYATEDPAWAERFENRCYECYQDTIFEKRSIAMKKVARAKRDIELKAYAKSDIGLIDICGVRQVWSNIRIELLRNDKTLTELAKLLGVADGLLNQMMYRDKTIKTTTIYKIAEWLITPFEVFVRLPRGTIRLKNSKGIPIVIYNRRAMRREK